MQCRWAADVFGRREGHGSQVLCHADVSVRYMDSHCAWSPHLPVTGLGVPVLYEWSSSKPNVPLRFELCPLPEQW